ncbi:unnamed protein product, partial [Onchocerca ochengi]|uniref:Uncharacterized protein n=1 Tax=Onchocerca ochengi TaxID=42157 RepID=A0A182F0I5_ONCOC
MGPRLEFQTPKGTMGGQK